MKKESLTRFAWLSIAAAVLTIGLKTIAWWITGSVGLLSDAMESVVNLVGGFMALAMLTVAERPADENHPYGHGKAEYFSSGVEGTLILIAALSIGVAAVDRLISPKPLEEIGIGLAVSIAASLVNFGVALLLLRVGTQEKLDNTRSKCPSFAHRRVDLSRRGRWCGHGSMDRLGATRSDCSTRSSCQHHLDGCRNRSKVRRWTHGYCAAR